MPAKSPRKKTTSTVFLSELSPLSYSQPKAPAPQPTSAIQAARALAEKGDVDAALKLGDYIVALFGNTAESIQWYRMAADEGSAEGQFKLGDIYYNGKGVPKDHTEAMKWFRKAADAGNVRAQITLGFMYHEGREMPRDYVEAARWFRKAADAGDAHAQINMGLIYSSGQGVPQDYVFAHMWYNLAGSKATGDEQKKNAEARDSIARKMTPQQIREAQRLAREWKPSK